MDVERFDAVVIGTGPGGEGAAMRLAKGGKRVAVVEKMPMVGGNCTHRGTIPSKALRQSIKVLGQQHRFVMGGRKTESAFDYVEMRRAAEEVISLQTDLRQGFYDRNRVPIFHGRARFASPHAVEVCVEGAPIVRLEAEHFVIATGSRPYRPPEIDFTHPRVHDADTLLRMTDTPQTMTIFGAGVIGCEYASMLKDLGIKINLVNNRSKLLAFLDDEIIDALSYHLRDSGVRIRHDEEMERCEALDDCVIVHLKSGKKLKSDVMLFAIGRTGNTQGMGLEDIGIAPDHRGQIQVDEHYRTAVPHIYAVGDVIGPPALASAAYDQGRFAGTHITEGECNLRLVSEVPTGIYTSPEISCIGANERELTERKVPYEVGMASFKSLARAQISGQTVGMLKILFHRETHAILGLHCFGDRAAEIIHIGQAIMAQPAPHNTIDYFANTTFNYPTMAEAYRVASLNGLNRLF